MAAAAMTVNVHVFEDTGLRVRRLAGGDRVWVEVGSDQVAMALFLDRAGLARVLGALHEADELLSTAVD